MFPISDLVAKFTKIDLPSMSDAMKYTPFGESAIEMIFFRVSNGNVSTLVLSNKQ